LAGKKITLAEEVVQKVLKEYQSTNIPLTELAKKYNIPYCIIRKVLISKGIQIRKNYKRKLRYTEEIIQNICNEYLAGKSVLQISKETSISEPTIKRWLKKNGISIRHQAYNKRTEEDLQKVFQYYLDHDISMKKITKNFHIGYGTMTNYMKKYNLHEQLRPHKVIFNENFFDNLDTEESMYWFGFLYADGSIGINTNTYEYRLSLILQQRDEGHIRKLLKALGISNVKEIIKFKESNFSTNPNKKFKQAYIRLSSKHMINVLCNYGFIPNKTYNGCISEKIFYTDNDELKDKKLFLAFLRGYIDGDGTIGKSVISICVFRKEVVDFLIKYIHIYLNMFPKISFKENRLFTINKLDINKKNGSYYINFSSIDTKNLKELLYKNAIVYLDRKRDKAAV